MASSLRCSGWSFSAAGGHLSTANTNCARLSLPRPNKDQHSSISLLWLWAAAKPSETQTGRANYSCPCRQNQSCLIFICAAVQSATVGFLCRWINLLGVHFHRIKIQKRGFKPDVGGACGFSRRCQSFKRGPTFQTSASPPQVGMSHRFSLGSGA